MTRPFLTAEWRYLVMLNFRVPAELLEPHVPRGTMLDRWTNDVWVSLVGFRFLHTRLAGLPIPGHRHFSEINLRFYVRPEASAHHDRRAVVFLKEIVPRRAIAAVAKWAYNEPYVTRPMRAEAPTEEVDQPGPVKYAWRHRGRWHQFGVTTDGAAVPIETGSVEEFIAEHYWGYTRQRDGCTIEYEVQRPRWRTWPTRAIEFDVDVAAEYGPAIAEALRNGPETALIADGSVVRVGRPRRL